MFSFEFFYCFCVYMFFNCKCKSLKRLGENMFKKKIPNKKEKENSKKNIKRKVTLKRKRKKQKYRISSPRISANKSHKLFAEVRGLEILYFCFLLCFSSSFSVLFYVISVVLCFRLVFLSFCIYNRKNTYENIFKKNEKL